VELQINSNKTPKSPNSLNQPILQSNAPPQYNADVDNDYDNNTNNLISNGEAKEVEDDKNEERDINNLSNDNNNNKLKKTDDKEELEKLLTKLITRNYEIILFYTIIFTGFGFILYIFSGKDYFIWIFAIIGLILGIIIDEIWYGGKQTTNYAMEKQPGQENKLEWQPYKFGEIVCSSEIEHPRTKNYIKKKTWVICDNNTMIVHKESTARIEGYHGWEIGAAICSLISAIISSIVVFEINIPYGDIGIIIGNICIIILLVIFGALIGALIEKQLRHMNLIPPIHVNYDYEIAIPLFEIGHFEYDKFGYYHVLQDARNVMCFERFILKWFRLLLLIFKNIYQE